MEKNVEVIRSYHGSFNLTELFSGNKALEDKLLHIVGMTKIALQIAEAYKGEIDLELLEICALHHDDGRHLQFKLLGNFNDREVSHNELGAMLLNQWCIQKKVAMTPEVALMRDVMQYHDRMHLLNPNFDEVTRRYVEIISDADDIENGCIGAVGYLLREYRTDAKGYNTTHPEHFGKIKENLWAFYEAGEWFDKLKYCESYAEYVLFAATLAMKSIKKYGDVAKQAMLEPSYGYQSALAGYDDIFGQVMSSADAAHAIKVLRGACGVN